MKLLFEHDRAILFSVLTRTGEFAPIDPVKFALPLIVITAFALNACTTLANRRDLYSPEKPHGPYTDRLAHAEMTAISADASHNRVKNH